MHHQRPSLPLQHQHMPRPHKVAATYVFPEAANVPFSRILRRRINVAAGITAGRQSPLWRCLTWFSPLTKNDKNVIDLTVKDGKLCNHLLNTTPKTTWQSRPTKQEAISQQSTHVSRQPGCTQDTKVYFRIWQASANGHFPSIHLPGVLYNLCMKSQPEKSKRQPNNTLRGMKIIVSSHPTSSQRHYIW